jgi:hypothetical protein
MMFSTWLLLQPYLQLLIFCPVFPCFNWLEGVAALVGGFVGGLLGGALDDKAADSGP